jgi:hypothetical protein
MKLEFDFETDEQIGVIEDISEYGFTRENHLQTKYGISLIDYEQMFDEQGGRCAICENLPIVKVLEVDHDHATGKVRGLLCGNCNKMLGHAKDSVKNLASAIKYLNQS